MCVVFCVFAGRPVMIVVEYMENGSLDSFLRVSVETIRETQVCLCLFVSLQVIVLWEINTTTALLNKTFPQWGLCL